MPTTNPSIIVRDKWQNAVAMAAHSLANDLDIEAIVPKNFTNGKNAAPRGVQNYDLALMAALEGYDTPLWATPKQIEAIGGIFNELCPKAQISIEKTSKRTGNAYCTNYKLVNLDEVSFPNGITQEAYDQIVLASNDIEIFDIPSPNDFKPTPLLSKKTPKPKAPKTSAPKVKIRETNVPSMRNPYDFSTDGRPANAVIDFTFDGVPFHFEGRTADEAKMLMDFALSSYVKAKKALA